MQLEVKVNNKEIFLNDDGAVCLRVSASENNGVYLDSDGVLHVKQGKPGGSTGIGGTQNLAGNGIEGEEDIGISILRCNSSVTRISKAEGDIDAPLISDIVNGILNP